MIIRAAVALHTILVPYHFGSFRLGTGAGPEALASNGVLNGLPVSGTTTITVESQASNEIQQCIAVDAALAAAARKACEAGDVPVVFSGNCHACLGSRRHRRPDRLVWFDAHGDLYAGNNGKDISTDGARHGTGCWTNLARQIPGFAAAEERDVLLAGGRDLDRGERVRLRRSNVRHYLPPALADGRDAAFTAALTVRGSAGRAYIHLDLDVIDPSELWANQFKVPGGVSVAWLAAALGDVRAHYEIAGVGVTAYGPSFTPPALAAPIVNCLLKAVMGHTTA